MHPKGLRDLGDIERQKLVIDYRWGDGDAVGSWRWNELVHLRVDVMVIRGTPAALAAKHAAGSIPVVMAAIGELLEAISIVAKLAQPGGNVTVAPRVCSNCPGSG